MRRREAPAENRHAYGREAAGRLPATEPASASPSSAAGLFDLPPLEPELFINRELSWLEFNRRVLDEAAEVSSPLIERAKFAAIFASNLDEFFMIRVAGVKRKIVAGIVDPGPDGRPPIAQAEAIQMATEELLDRHAALITQEILPGLADQGVEVVGWDALSPVERQAMGLVFDRDIFPVLTPQAIDRARRFPHISNLSLNLLVDLDSPLIGARFARVKVPAVLPRLMPVPVDAADALGEPGHARFVWLEQVISAHLDRLFPGNEIVAAYPFHVVRDSDLNVDEVDDEDGNEHDFLYSMREHLQQRTFGTVVQVLTDPSMPEDVRAWLVDQLHATELDSYVVDGPLAAQNLMELLGVDRPDLKDAPYAPRHTDFRALLATESDPGSPEEIDIFSVLRHRDILLHHPYQSFAIVAEFLRRASTDRDVVAIKQTLYRIGKNSPLPPLLIDARDDDTQIAVLVEVKARFDEENNISLARLLEQHGVHVAYGVQGLKTHCKATLVVRREPEGLRRYVHLSTGNYNASTARIYEDFGLLTANEEIGNDVSELFNVLTGFAVQDEYRKLLVAPVNLRRKIIERIYREIDAHKRTGNGEIVFKMNSLVDKESIRALYAASRAGVKITLIIRGVCCLRPGVPGWSENIRVISIVGRYLEHSRVYYFRNGGDDELYLGSADLMERNLERRVEAVYPVEDPVIKAQIRDEILPAYQRDTVNARQLMPDGAWQPVVADNEEPPFDLHAWLMQRYA
jgi:polyphosphate kinase